ncbi:ThiJ/PfpI [Crassisporium funariophilum]|nr:ThiJ/PfpI [Crassisporium funariophilum]
MPGSTFQPPPKLSFGVLLLPNHHYIFSAGPITHINNHSREFVTLMDAPEVFRNRAPVLEWHYIAHDLSPIRAAAGPSQMPTCTYASCPPIDYLIVPGTGPNQSLPEGCAAFVKERFAGLKGLLTIATGALCIAETGVLDGFNVCANKFSLKMYAEHDLLNKNVKWVGDRRWMVDGKIWSSAEIGLDLAAEFVKVHFDAKLVELLRTGSEYEPGPAQPDPFEYVLEGVELD